VAEAVIDGAWIDDIKKAINIQGFLQVLAIWEDINDIHLNQRSEDI
jgi:hypothetical protein